jgi:hypothetical protein
VRERLSPGIDQSVVRSGSTLDTADRRDQRHLGSGIRRRASRPVGRVLCARSRGPAAIHLGLPLPTASSGLPASSGGQPSIARAGAAPLGALPLDLAPGGVYRAAQVTLSAGGLLHHRFTLTSGRVRRRFAFCGTVPRVAPGRRYRPPCPAEPGPSSARQLLLTRRGRPAGSPAAGSSIRASSPVSPASTSGRHRQRRRYRPSWRWRQWIRLPSRLPYSPLLRDC